jgi:hypothetical protein
MVDGTMSQISRGMPQGFFGGEILPPSDKKTRVGESNKQIFEI